MKFMHQNRRLLSLFSIALLALSTSAGQAQGYYNPKTGRFMSVDPSGTGIVLAPGLLFHGRNPIVVVRKSYELQFADGMNFYNFSRNNPINFTDPSGLIAVDEFLARSFVKATDWAGAFLDDRETVNKVAFGFALAGTAALGGALIIAAAPAVVAMAQATQVYIATAGTGGAALLTRGSQFASTQGQRLLTAARGVITRWNIDQILQQNRFDHIFNPKHQNHLLGTPMEAINKVVQKVFELDANGGLSRGTLSLGTKIDGLSVQITGWIDPAGTLSIANFWVVP